MEQQAAQNEETKQQVERNKSVTFGTGDGLDVVQADKTADFSGEKLELLLGDCMEQARQQFQVHYDSVLSQGYIVETLKNQETVLRADALETFVANLCHGLWKGQNQILEEMGSAFEAKTSEGHPGISVAMEPFCRRMKMMPLVAGGVTFGLLAIWSAIVARGSNLGAYILIAKLVSAIRDLGISLGGTANVAQSVAMIGGPVVLGLFAALIAAGITYGVVVLTWRQQFAKYVIGEFETNGYEAVFVREQEIFWEQAKVTVEMQKMKGCSGVGESGALASHAIGE